MVGQSHGHIDAVVILNDCRVRLIGFYGNPTTQLRNPTTQLRRFSWDLLIRVVGDRDEPVVVLGDFNKILQPEEKFGGRDRSKAQMERFRSAIQHCKLDDVAFKGPQFT